MPTNSILPPYLAGKLAVKDFDPAQHSRERAGGIGSGGAAPAAGIESLREQQTAQLLVCANTSRSQAQRLLTRLGCTPQQPRLRADQFSTGDRFTEIYGDFAHKPVWVAQSASAGPQLTDALTDAMQALWAGRHAGAKRNATLFLSSEFDPQMRPTALNRLVARLAKVSGAQRIFYVPELCDDTAPALPSATPGQVLRGHSATLANGAHPLATEAILRIASGQVKHLARRRCEAVTAGVLVWSGLRDAALAHLAAPDRAPGAPRYIVFGVHTGSQLPERLVQELAAKGVAAQLGEHQYQARSGEVLLSAPLAGQHVVVVANTRQSPSAGTDAGASATVPTWEALLLAQQARDAGAAHVTVVHAYQMNGRSDRKFDRSADQSHFPPYAALVAAWFKGLKVDRQILVEAHDMHTQSVAFDPKRDAVADVGGMELLLDHHVEQLPPGEAAHAVLAWPDAGSRRRGADMERFFTDRPSAEYPKRVVVCDKVHNAGHDTGVQVSCTAGRIDPAAHVFLADDEVGSGGTLAGAIALLHARGAGTGAGQLHALISHNNLPVSVVQRNLLYAWFRASGAHGLSFLDTQPTGQVVSSFQELRQLGVDDASIDKFCAARGITDWTPERYEALFANLNGFVKVVSAAPQIALKILDLGPEK